MSFHRMKRSYLGK